MMNRVSAVSALLGLLCLGVAVQAVTIATVPVGDQGNAGELSGAGAGGYGPDTICGSVGYSYNIGKYEVTAAQYTDFLNKVAKTDTYGLYNTYMDRAVYSYGCNIKRTGTSGSYTYSVASDWANRPVNYVSYWDACRFANWLHNGQPTGLQTAATTERGVYTLDGYTGQDGRTIQRNPGWKWAVTSEDEWYKAAHYKGGGATAGYWDYPMQSDITTTPSNDLTNPDGGNTANYRISIDDYTIGNPYWRTNAGEFENSESAYGTFDQGGNVWEWTEAIVYQGSDYAYRGVRGGSFDYGGSRIQASGRSSCNPTYEYYDRGFRVSAVVPEPPSLVALAGGLMSLLSLRRRRA
jgi:sulfatase modifying factor 1